MKSTEKIIDEFTKSAIYNLEKEKEHFYNSDKFITWSLVAIVGVFIASIMPNFEDKQTTLFLSSCSVVSFVLALFYKYSLKSLPPMIGLFHESYTIQKIKMINEGIQADDLSDFYTKIKTLCYINTDESKSVLKSSKRIVVILNTLLFIYYVSIFCISTVSFLFAKDYLFNSFK